MKISAHLIISLAAFLTSASTAIAEGPFPTTVADIHANPTPGKLIELKGRIVERLKDNEFRFDDGTGRLVLDAGPPWWHKVSLAPGIEVTVVGRVSMGPRHAARPFAPEIDVHWMQMVAGGVIRVRDSDPAPWAGGPRGRQGHGGGGR